MYKSIEPLGIDRKYNLTLNEAAEYFGIGINTLRELTNREGKKFAIRVGDKKTLIVRHKFEEFCDTHYDLTA